MIESPKFNSFNDYDLNVKKRHEKTALNTDMSSINLAVIFSSEAPFYKFTIFV